MKASHWETLQIGIVGDAHERARETREVTVLDCMEPSGVVQLVPYPRRMSLMFDPQRTA